MPLRENDAHDERRRRGKQQEQPADDDAGRHLPSLLTLVIYLRNRGGPLIPQCAFGPRGLSSPGAFRRRCARLLALSTASRVARSWLTHQAANAANELFPGLTWMQYPSLRIGGSG